MHSATALIDGTPPAPLVHAAAKAARKAFYDAYAWFVAAFRKAAEKLRQGDRNAVSRPAASHRLCRSWRDSPLACALCQPHRRRRAILPSF
ncbi:MAG: hypothetical protein QOF89_6222 [Acidobacteriota bacterium]|nr:hypothetical protein [Acidobacteriota bacterium]